MSEGDSPLFWGRQSTETFREQLLRMGSDVMKSELLPSPSESTASSSDAEHFDPNFKIVLQQAFNEDRLLFSQFPVETQINVLVQISVTDQQQMISAIACNSLVSTLKSRGPYWYTDDHVLAVIKHLQLPSDLEALLLSVGWLYPELFASTKFNQLVSALQDIGIKSASALLTSIVKKEKLESFGTELISPTLRQQITSFANTGKVHLPTAVDVSSKTCDAKLRKILSAASSNTELFKSFPFNVQLKTLPKISIETLSDFIKALVSGTLTGDLKHQGPYWYSNDQLLAVIREAYPDTSDIRRSLLSVGCEMKSLFAVRSLGEIISILRSAGVDTSHKLLTALNDGIVVNEKPLFRKIIANKLRDFLEIELEVTIPQVQLPTRERPAGGGTQIPIQNMSSTTSSVAAPLSAILSAASSNTKLFKSFPFNVQLKTLPKISIETLSDFIKALVSGTLIGDLKHQGPYWYSNDQLLAVIREAYPDTSDIRRSLLSVGCEMKSIFSTRNLGELVSAIRGTGLNSADDLRKALKKGTIEVDGKPLFRKLIATKLSEFLEADISEHNSAPKKSEASGHSVESLTTQSASPLSKEPPASEVSKPKLELETQSQSSTTEPVKPVAAALSAILSAASSKTELFKSFPFNVQLKTLPKISIETLSDFIKALVSGTLIGDLKHQGPYWYSNAQLLAVIREAYPDTSDIRRSLLSVGCEMKSIFSTRNLGELVSAIRGTGLNSADDLRKALKKGTIEVDGKPLFRKLIVTKLSEFLEADISEHNSAPKKSEASGHSVESLTTPVRGTEKFVSDLLTSVLEKSASPLSKERPASEVSNPKRELETQSQSSTTEPVKPVAAALSAILSAASSNTELFKSFPLNVQLKTLPKISIETLSDFIKALVSGTLIGDLKHQGPYWYSNEQLLAIMRISFPDKLDLRRSLLCVGCEMKSIFSGKSLGELISTLKGIGISTAEELRRELNKKNVEVNGKQLFRKLITTKLLQFFQSDGLNSRSSASELKKRLQPLITSSNTLIMSPNLSSIISEVALSDERLFATFPSEIQLQTLPKVNINSVDDFLFSVMTGTLISKMNQVSTYQYTDEQVLCLIQRIFPIQDLRRSLLCVGHVERSLFENSYSLSEYLKLLRAVGISKNVHLLRELHLKGSPEVNGKPLFNEQLASKLTKFLESDLPQYLLDAAASEECKSPLPMTPSSLKRKSFPSSKVTKFSSEPTDVLMLTPPEPPNLSFLKSESSETDVSSSLVELSLKNSSQSVSTIPTSTTEKTVAAALSGILSAASSNTELFKSFPFNVQLKTLPKISIETLSDFIKALVSGTLIGDLKHQGPYWYSNDQLLAVIREAYPDTSDIRRSLLSVGCEMKSIFSTRNLGELVSAIRGTGHNSADDLRKALKKGTIEVDGKPLFRKLIVTKLSEFLEADISEHNSAPKKSEASGHSVESLTTQSASPLSKEPPASEVSKPKRELETQSQSSTTEPVKPVAAALSAILSAASSNTELFKSFPLNVQLKTLPKISIETLSDFIKALVSGTLIGDLKHQGPYWYSNDQLLAVIREAYPDTSDIRRSLLSVGCEMKSIFSTRNLGELVSAIRGTGLNSADDLRKALKKGTIEVDGKPLFRKLIVTKLSEFLEADISEHNSALKKSEASGHSVESLTTQSASPLPLTPVRGTEKFVSDLLTSVLEKSASPLSKEPPASEVSKPKLELETQSQSSTTEPVKPVAAALSAILSAASSNTELFKSFPLNVQLKTLPKISIETLSDFIKALVSGTLIGDLKHQGPYWYSNDQLLAVIREAYPDTSDIRRSLLSVGCEMKSIFSTRNLGELVSAIRGTGLNSADDLRKALKKGTIEVDGKPLFRKLIVTKLSEFLEADISEHNSAPKKSEASGHSVESLTTPVRGTEKFVADLLTSVLEKSASPLSKEPPASEVSKPKRELETQSQSSATEPVKPVAAALSAILSAASSNTELFKSFPFNVQLKTLPKISIETLSDFIKALVSGTLIGDLKHQGPYWYSNDQLLAVIREAYPDTSDIRRSLLSVGCEMKSIFSTRNLGELVSAIRGTGLNSADDLRKALKKGTIEVDGKPLFRKLIVTKLSEFLEADISEHNSPPKKSEASGHSVESLTTQSASPLPLTPVRGTEKFVSDLLTSVLEKSASPLSKEPPASEVSKPKLELETPSQSSTTEPVKPVAAALSAILSAASSNTELFKSFPLNVQLKTLPKISIETLSDFIKALVSGTLIGDLKHQGPYWYSNDQLLAVIRNAFPKQSDVRRSILSVGCEMKSMFSTRNLGDIVGALLGAGVTNAEELKKALKGTIEVDGKPLFRKLIATRLSEFLEADISTVKLTPTIEVRKIMEPKHEGPKLELQSQSSTTEPVKPVAAALSAILSAASSNTELFRSFPLNVQLKTLPKISIETLSDFIKALVSGTLIGDLKHQGPYWYSNDQLLAVIREAYPDTSDIRRSLLSVGCEMKSIFSTRNLGELVSAIRGTGLNSADDLRKALKKGTIEVDGKPLFRKLIVTKLSEFLEADGHSVESLTTPVRGTEKFVADLLTSVLEKSASPLSKEPPASEVSNPKQGLKMLSQSSTTKSLTTPVRGTEKFVANLLASVLEKTAVHSKEPLASEAAKLKQELEMQSESSTTELITTPVKGTEKFVADLLTSVLEKSASPLSKERPASEVSNPKQGLEMLSQSSTTKSLTTPVRGTEKFVADLLASVLEKTAVHSKEPLASEAAKLKQELEMQSESSTTELITTPVRGTEKFVADLLTSVLEKSAAAHSEEPLVSEVSKLKQELEMQSEYSTTPPVRGTEKFVADLLTSVLEKSASPLSKERPASEVSNLKQGLEMLSQSSTTKSLTTPVRGTEKFVADLLASVLEKTAVHSKEPLASEAAKLKQELKMQSESSTTELITTPVRGTEKFVADLLTSVLEKSASPLSKERPASEVSKLKQELKMQSQSSTTEPVKPVAAALSAILSAASSKTDLFKLFPFNVQLKTLPKISIETLSDFIKALVSGTLIGDLKHQGPYWYSNDQLLAVIREAYPDTSDIRRSLLSVGCEMKSIFSTRNLGELVSAIRGTGHNSADDLRKALKKGTIEVDGKPLFRKLIVTKLSEFLEADISEHNSAPKKSEASGHSVESLTTQSASPLSKEPPASEVSKPKLELETQSQSSATEPVKPVAAALSAILSAASSNTELFKSFPFNVQLKTLPKISIETLSDFIKALVSGTLIGDLKHQGPYWYSNDQLLAVIREAYPDTSDIRRSLLSVGCEMKSIFSARNLGELVSAIRGTGHNSADDLRKALKKGTIEVDGKPLFRKLIATKLSEFLEEDLSSEEEEKSSKSVDESSMKSDSCRKIEEETNHLRNENIEIDKEESIIQTSHVSSKEEEVISSEEVLEVHNHTEEEVGKSSEQEDEENESQGTDTDGSSSEIKGEPNIVKSELLENEVVSDEEINETSEEVRKVQKIHENVPLITKLRDTFPEELFGSESPTAAAGQNQHSRHRRRFLDKTNLRNKTESALKKFADCAVKEEEFKPKLPEQAELVPAPRFVQPKRPPMYGRMPKPISPMNRSDDTDLSQLYQQHETYVHHTSPLRGSPFRPRASPSRSITPTRRQILLLGTDNGLAKEPTPEEHNWRKTVESVGRLGEINAAIAAEMKQLKSLEAERRAYEESHDVNVEVRDAEVRELSYIHRQVYPTSRSNAAVISARSISPTRPLLERQKQAPDVQRQQIAHPQQWSASPQRQIAHPQQRGVSLQRQIAHPQQRGVSLQRQIAHPQQRGASPQQDGEVLEQMFNNFEAKILFVEQTIDKQEKQQHQEPFIM